MLQPHLLATGATAVAGSKKTRALFATCRYIRNAAGEEANLFRLLDLIHFGRRPAVAINCTRTLHAALRAEGISALQVLEFAAAFGRYYRRRCSADVLQLSTPAMLGKAVTVCLMEHASLGHPAPRSLQALFLRAQELRGQPFRSASRYHVPPRSEYYLATTLPLLLCLLYAHMGMALARNGEVGQQIGHWYLAMGPLLLLSFGVAVRASLDDFIRGKNEETWLRSPPYGRDLQLAALFFQPSWHKRLACSELPA